MKNPGWIAGLVAAAGTCFAGCGKALPTYRGSLLGDAVLSTGGGTRVDGADMGAIYSVTQVIAATPGHTLPSDSYLPFRLGVNGSPTPAYLGFNDTTQNSQVPFYFDYGYPANNYKLADAHLVIDTQRDNSDTEGIFVDGVMSGRPPQGTSTGNVNPSSPGIESHNYYGNTVGALVNMFYIDWSLSHYKQYKQNSFDLDIAQLLTGSPKTLTGVVGDGHVQVVTGDDSPIFSANLFLKGYTISKDPLVCATSPTYTFQNVHVHNDGDSIGQASFTGTVLTPYQSKTSTGSTFQSVEWFYDAQLPKVALSNVNISSASLHLNVKRAPTTANPKAAIVINGVAVAETGFDTSTFTGAVESWETGTGQTYFESVFLPSLTTTMPSNSASPIFNPALTLDLVQLLGADRLKTLMAQGKLNVALAGSISYVDATGDSSARGFTAPVHGPELWISGDYNTQLCAVPNDPTSPLNDSDPIPADSGDHRSPLVSSLGASEITSSSAVIQWLTDEPADSQVCYGIGNTATCTAVSDTAAKVTFHRVAITGLSPYKVYQYNAVTVDASPNLNSTTSATQTFQTLR